MSSRAHSVRGPIMAVMIALRRVSPPSLIFRRFEQHRAPAERFETPNAERKSRSNVNPVSSVKTATGNFEDDLPFHCTIVNTDS